MYFVKKVNTRSRKAMVEFLTEHFRYPTTGGWNNATGYAHNMKIYKLPLTREERDKAWDFLGCNEAYDNINFLIEDWNIEHGWEYQAYFNGRSGGYLVFCKGGKETNRHEEDGKVVANTKIYSTPGAGVDHGEDFEDWEMYQLRERVKLVQSFDQLAESILAEVKWMANNCEVVDEEYTVKKTRKALKEVSAA